MEGSRENREVVLILKLAEFRTLVEVAEVAVLAAPRKTTFRRLVKMLGQVEAW